jgi:hypothetical protein
MLQSGSLCHLELSPRTVDKEMLAMLTWQR